MTAAQERDYNEFSRIWCIPFCTDKLDFSKVFGNSNPVTIEIGFGMGTATAEIAEANPGSNYLGIEVHKPGVGRLLGEINRRKLRNLYIVPYDALEVLENMVPDSSVRAFHIFFPDPWPKKKHHKRRLVQRPHTDLLSRKLIPEGYIYMVTDWQEYAEYALQELADTPGLQNRYRGFAEHQKWRPQTKFEAKGIAAEHSISELYFIRQDNAYERII
jgi:tRNA (guanine-N7-)-methyltransferase